MPGQTTDLIKEKLDVADVIKAYVHLAPAGKNLKGLCPFHKEKSGSFMVSPDRQMWHCFGCGLGGDMFGFVMRYENVDFIEALKMLADKAGVELKRFGNNDQKKYDSLYEINRIAKDYFCASLGEPAGALAMKYLHERGLKDETISTFELGVALPGNDNLMRHLTKMGFSPETIKDAGLVSKNERGLYYDFFRNRIMFPLHNSSGKVIGFTGRVMPGNESPEIGKYVNSHDSPIFNKSKLLFGFWKTKGVIRETNTAVLVEGQMDFLMSYQDGITNAVATSGTALTAEHLTTLRRLCENLALAFDNDGAGRAAAERTIDLAATVDFNVKVLPLTEGVKDPADIVKSEPGKMSKLIAEAMPAMEYYFQYHGITKDQPLVEKKKAIRAVLTKIKTISSPVEQSHWLGQLSSRSGMSEQVLAAEMRQLKIEGGKVGSQPVQPQADALGQAGLPAGRQEVILERLLSLVLSAPALLPHVEKHYHLFPAEYKEAFEAIKNPSTAPKAGPIAELLDLVHLRSSLESTDPEKLEEEFKQLILAFQADAIKERRKQLQEELKQAEKAKDEEKIAKLLAEYQGLSKKL